MGGRQKVLELASNMVKKVEFKQLDPINLVRSEEAKPLLLAEEELAHSALIQKMGDKALWAKYA